MEALLDEARGAQQSRDFASARSKVAEAVQAGLSSIGTCDDDAAIALLVRLAVVAQDSRELKAAQLVERRLVEIRERTLPPDHPDLQKARMQLSSTLYSQGLVEEARALCEKVVAIWGRTLSEDDPNLLGARDQLATLLYTQGDLQGARALDEQVLAIQERALPDEHPSLQKTRLNLASTLFTQGDHAGARRLYEKVLTLGERTLPADDSRMLVARMGLANALAVQGELAHARSIGEELVRIYERSVPDDHPHLQMARMNLAETLRELGDLARARALLEKVLPIQERSLPGDNLDLQSTRIDLALVLKMQGDAPGARAMEEEILSILERTLPEDHPYLQKARLNLAVTLRNQGDLATAKELQEKAVAIRERDLPDDHPDVQSARMGLANTLFELGDLPGARALEERILDILERDLPADDPKVQVARSNLANMLFAEGDFGEARARYEQALSAWQRVLPEDDIDVLRVQGHLAWTLAALGDRPALSVALHRIAAGTARALERSLALPLRERAELVVSLDQILSDLLSLAPSVPDEEGLEEELFALVETSRARATGTTLSCASSSDPELAALVDRGRRLRTRLNDLVSGTGAGGQPTDASTEKVAAIVRERDEVEATILGKLAASDRPAPRIDRTSLARSLPPGACAVGYRRSVRGSLDPTALHQLRDEPRLLAHVLRTDGTLTRIDLGPQEVLAASVARWRESVGEPFERTEPAALPLAEIGAEASPQGPARGVGVSAGPRGNSDRAAGEELRRLVLDPVLEAAGKAEVLFVCPDDVLYLTPLDALPAGGSANADAGLVGDHLRIATLPSFASLLQGPRPPAGTASLVAVGGVDYDAVIEPDPGALAEASAPALADAGPSGARSGPLGGSWSGLPATLTEAQGIAAIFHRVFDRDATVLTAGEATKKALRERSQGVEFLHVATHGYFAPESVPSLTDPRTGGAARARMGLREAVEGLAPMTLCGLALAGANRGRDSLGRVPGILTAEELAGIDLSGCKLAVLSACETGVGMRRAGQGVQSLQAALHAAGVRTAITALWKVDDAATRRLMELFYAGLWIEGKPVSEALWGAKSALRAEGHPVRDWAGWVLSGDPD